MTFIYQKIEILALFLAVKWNCFKNQNKFKVLNVNNGTLTFPTKSCMGTQTLLKRVFLSWAHPLAQCLSSHIPPEKMVYWKYRLRKILFGVKVYQVNVTGNIRDRFYNLTLNVTPLLERRFNDAEN